MYSMRQVFFHMARESVRYRSAACNFIQVARALEQHSRFNGHWALVALKRMRIKHKNYSREPALDSNAAQF